MLCFWTAGLLCAVAEYSDLADGRIARKRGEVSDFGKLADPFCDVIYRMSVFLTLLLPAGGVGYVVSLMPTTAISDPTRDIIPFADLIGRQSVYVLGSHGFGAGIVPWLPVLVMVMREIVAGALRAMAASRGLVLAARASGKLKAWLQGLTIGVMFSAPALTGHCSEWQLTFAFYATWVCAVVSVLSILEYIWVNRRTLAGLLVRHGVSH